MCCKVVHSPDPWWWGQFGRHIQTDLRPPELTLVIDGEQNESLKVNEINKQTSATFLNLPGNFASVPNHK